MGSQHRKINAGEVFKTNEGGSVTAIEYFDSKRVVIQHNDQFKFRAVVPAIQLRGGSVKNPYIEKVYGVGYVGAGNYKTAANKKDTPQYKSWSSMLRRAYSAEYHAKNPAYIGVTVCREWMNFQTFAAWWDEQPHSGSAKFELDKDLRIGGNREYSPAACSFVPGPVNRLIGKQNSVPGKLTRGVVPTRGRFEARLTVDGRRLTLGAYATPEQAFHAYTTAKERHVRGMADHWKWCIHQEVYSYLKNWVLS